MRNKYFIVNHKHLTKGYVRHVIMVILRYIFLVRIYIMALSIKDINSTSNIIKKALVRKVLFRTFHSERNGTLSDLSTCCIIDKVNMFKFRVVKQSYKYLSFRNKSISNIWVIESIDNHDPVIDPDQSCYVHFILVDFKLFSGITTLNDRTVKCP